MRLYAFFAESYAVRRLSLSSSSSTTRCTYGLFRAAWAAPIAPAPALAAFFFFDAMALLEIGGFGRPWRSDPVTAGRRAKRRPGCLREPYPGATSGVTPPRSACARRSALGRHRARAAGARRARLRLLESLLEHLVDALDERELDLRQQALGEVVEIGLVELRRDHTGHPSALRGERLLLEAADRQH